MVDYVVMGGQAGGFSGSTQVLGAAPALATNGSATPRAGRNKLNWKNPTDPRHFASLLYRFQRSNIAVQQPFNGAASPYLNVGKAEEFKDDVPADLKTPRVVVYDYYLVTIDQYGYPLTKTSANALSLGHD